MPACAADLSGNVIVKSIPANYISAEDALQRLGDADSELFNSETIDEQDKFDAYAESLALKARQCNLDDVWLRKCLTAIKKHASGDSSKKRNRKTDAPVAKTYIPVAAYYSENLHAWIIIVNWEINAKGYSTISHIRKFAYDNTIELIAYSTCL